MTAFTDLLARVQNAEGPDRRLDGELDVLVQHENEAWPPDYTASLDAALALVERVLPGWRMKLEGFPRGQQFAQVYYSVHRGIHHGEGRTLALALVAAMLNALMAKEAKP